MHQAGIVENINVILYGDLEHKNKQIKTEGQGQKITERGLMPLHA